MSNAREMYLDFLYHLIFFLSETKENYARVMFTNEFSPIFSLNFSNDNIHDTHILRTYKYYLNTTYTQTHSLQIIE